MMNTIGSLAISSSIAPFNASRIVISLATVVEAARRARAATAGEADHLTLATAEADREAVHAIRANILARDVFTETHTRARLNAMH